MVWNYEHYRDIGTTEEGIKECMNHELLNNICLTYDEGDSYKYLENTLFKLYAYNTYINDIFNKCRYYHFENILKKEGFELVSLYIPKKLDADTREALTEILQEITDEQFEDYIRADNKDLDIYKPINDRVVILNLSSDDVELLRNYKDITMSKYKIKEHFNITNLLKKMTI